MKRIINVYNDLKSRAEISKRIAPAIKIEESSKPSENKENAESKESLRGKTDKAPESNEQKQTGRKTKRDA